MRPATKLRIDHIAAPSFIRFASNERLKVVKKQRIEEELLE